MLHTVSIKAQRLTAHVPSGDSEYPDCVMLYITHNCVRCKRLRPSLFRHSAYLRVTLLVSYKPSLSDVLSSSSINFNKFSTHGSCPDSIFSLPMCCFSYHCICCYLFFMSPVAAVPSKCRLLRVPLRAY